MLAGTVINPECYNYALVIISKGTDSNEYLVRGDFTQRIWLRYGPGEYTVEVRGLSAIMFPSGIGEEDEAKLRAIFDYIIDNTAYDDDSMGNINRKKQDALTVLGNHLAVCQGYSQTFAALARAAGFEVKYVISNSMNHSWNHVKVNGV